MYIQDIKFNTVDKRDGFLCDRCGAYITNIYTVTYSDGLVARYGMECFKKLFDAGNLTEFGRNLMMKALKSMREIYEKREKWLSVNSFEEAEKKCLISTWDIKERWEGYTFEECKDFYVNKCFEHDLKRVKEELARFKKVNFDLSKFEKD